MYFLVYLRLKIGYKVAYSKGFTLPIFLFAGYFGVSGTLRYFGGGDGVESVVGLVIIMVLGILVALVVLVALDFIDALVF